MKRKYSVELSNLGQFVDRYIACGYNDDYTVEQLLKRATTVKKITGCELCGTWHITEQSAEKMKRLIQDSGLQLVSIIPDYFAQRKWGHGAFSSSDPGLRSQLGTEIYTFDVYEMLIKRSRSPLTARSMPP